MSEIIKIVKVLDLRQRRPIDPLSQKVVGAFLDHARDRLTIYEPAYKYHKRRRCSKKDMRTCIHSGFPSLRIASAVCRRWSIWDMLVY